MKLKVLGNFLMIFAFALFSCIFANAQVVDTVKKAADKTKDVTVDATKKAAKETKKAADKTKDVTVDATKDAADKTKDVTVDTVDKTVELTKDATEETKNVTKKVAEKTKDGTVNAAKTTGGYTVKLVDNIKEQPVKERPNGDGRWLTVTNWDGKKWVSKREWVPNKKQENITESIGSVDGFAQKLEMSRAPDTRITRII